jgi:methyl-accepting chemotaxis protein
MSVAAGNAHAGGEKAEFASTRAAGLVGQAADRAASISHEGEAIVAHSKKSLALSQDVILDAEDTDKAIRGLTSATQQIDRVAALIGQVASQTNLLALNATIEAARAGEAGRGFAVVATEIKSLAAQTTSATGEIGLQIQAIHEASRNCGQALQTIRARTLSTREIAGEVVERVSVQSVIINEIAGTIHQAAQEARGVLSSATEVHQAADLSNGSAIDVLKLARDLDAEAKAIQAEIETFFADHDAMTLHMTNAAFA